MEHISETYMSGSTINYVAACEEKNKDENYYINDMIMKRGRTLITGMTSYENFVFSLKLAIKIANTDKDKDSFLDMFNISDARILYLDLEVGDYYLKEYLKILMMNKKVKDLHFKCLPGLNLSSKEQMEYVNRKIEEFKAQILFITPLEYCFANQKGLTSEIIALREAFDTLISKYDLSIVTTSTDNYDRIIRHRQLLVYFDNHVFLRNGWLDCVRSVNSRKFSSKQIAKLTDDKLNALCKEHISLN